MFFRERVRRTYVRVLNEEECLKETYYTRLRRKIGRRAPQYSRSKLSRIKSKSYFDAEGGLSVPGIKLRSGETIVFAGDSITDCGRFQFPPLGNGYVYIFNNLLLAKHPELKVNVVNAGVSGNTVVDLKSRWEDDVLSLNPDWISILIGINDIHRHLGGQPGLDPESYYRNYREILEMARKSSRNVKLILLAPFYISRATVEDSFRRKILDLLPSYIDKVEKLSKEFNAIYIDLHAMFQKLLNHREPTVYAPEAVHPTFAGHTAIALAIMQALEG